MEFFLFATPFTQALGPTQPPIQLVAGAPSLGLKQPRREAGYTHSSSVEVKKVWSYTSTPQMSSYMAWWSVKAQGQLKLTFTLHQLLKSYSPHFW
jgi:hypothetical protein